MIWKDFYYPICKCSKQKSVPHPPSPTPPSSAFRPSPPLYRNPTNRRSRCSMSRQSIAHPCVSTSSQTARVRQGQRRRRRERRRRRRLGEQKRQIKLTPLNSRQIILIALLRPTSCQSLPTHLPIRRLNRHRRSQKPGDRSCSASRHVVVCIMYRFRGVHDACTDLEDLLEAGADGGGEAALVVDGLVEVEEGGL